MKKKQKNKIQDFSISKLNLESGLFKASLSVESLYFYDQLKKQNLTALIIFLLCLTCLFFFYCPLLSKMIPIVLLLSVCFSESTGLLHVFLCLLAVC